MTINWIQFFVTHRRADTAIDRLNRLSAVCAAVVLGLPLCLQGQSITFTPPAPLNTNAETDIGAHGSPHIATDGLGNWVAVWDSNDSLNDTIGVDSDILVSHSDDGGFNWSPSVALNTDAQSDIDVHSTIGSDRRPHLATDRNGTWVAVWSNRDIRVARSVDNGSTWTAPSDLYTSPARDSRAKLVTDGDGLWVALWQSGDEILASRSTNVAMGWDAPISLAPPSDDPSQFERVINSDPYVGIDDQGRLVAAWTYLGIPFYAQPKPAGLPPPPTHLRISRSTDQGLTWSLSTPLIDLESLSGWNTDPHMALGNEGHWVVTWLWARPPSTDGFLPPPMIVAARSDDSGQSWSEQVELSLDRSDNFFDPQVVTDRKGNWIAVWEGGNAYSLDDGASWSTIENFDPRVTPRLATDGQSRWLAVWMNNNLGPGHDIFVSIGEFVAASLVPWHKYR